MACHKEPRPSDTTYHIAWSPIIDFKEVNRNLWVQDVSMVYTGLRTNDTKILGRYMLNINKTFSSPLLDAIGHTSSTVLAPIIKYDTDNAQIYLETRGLNTTVDNTYVVKNSLDRCYASISSNNEQLDIINGYGAVVFSSNQDDYFLFGYDGNPQFLNCDASNNQVIVTSMDGVTQRTFPMQSEGMMHSIDNGKLVYTNVDPSIGYSEEDAHFFIATYVMDGQAITDNYIYACNNLFGLRHSDIFDSINELIDDPGSGNNIGDMFLTYAINSQYCQEHMPWLFDELFAFYEGGQVRIDVDNASIWYEATGYSPDIGNVPAATMQITPLGQQPSEWELHVTDPVDDSKTTSVPLFIPLELINTLPLHKKYELKRWGLCLITNIAHEEKLKFYQTKWFRIIMIVFSMVLAILGQPEMFIGMIGSIAAEAIDNPIVSIVISIIVIAYGAYTSPEGIAGLSMSDMLQVIVKVSLEVKTYFIEREVSDLQEQAEEIDKELQKTEEAMAAMKRDILLLPMQQYDQFWQTAFLDPMDAAFKLYDTMLEPPRLPQTIPGANK